MILRKLVRNLIDGQDVFVVNRVQMPGNDSAAASRSLLPSMPTENGVERRKMFPGQSRDEAAVQAAGQESAQGHIAHEPLGHGPFQRASQFPAVLR